MKITHIALLSICLCIALDGHGGCQGFKLVINGKTYFEPGFITIETGADSVNVKGIFGGSCYILNMQVREDTVLLHNGGNNFKIPPGTATLVFQGFSSNATLGWITVFLQSTLISIRKTDPESGNIQMTMTKGRQARISFAEPPISLEVYDIQGKKAYYSNKDGEMVFDSSLNPPGIYFLSAEFTRGRWIRKKFILP